MARLKRIARPLAAAALLSLGLAIGMLDSADASGASYYVSSAGNDSNPGTHSAPWRTVGHAAATVAAGATVLIEGGTYSEDVRLRVSGTEASPITFKSALGETATLRSFWVGASNLTIRNLSVSGAAGDCVTVAPALSNVAIRGDDIERCGRDGIHFVRPSGSPYTTSASIVGDEISGVGVADSTGNDLTVYGKRVMVQGNDLSGAPKDAIDLWGDHLTFRQNDIHDIISLSGRANSALHTWTGRNDGVEGLPATNVVISQNHITNIVGANAQGVSDEGSGAATWGVFDNLLNNVGNTGMSFDATGGEAESLAVYNNTFYRAGPTRDVYFGARASGTFADNIVRGGGGVYIANPASVTEDYNLLYNAPINTGGGPHDLKTNPEFVNPLTGNFYLEPTSPAIDAADDGSVAPLRRYDILGNAIVGGDDMGAYEFQGSQERGDGLGHLWLGAQVHSLWSAVSRSEMTAELNDLQTAGANVLRVDVGWGSLETAKGYYDATYLAKLDALAAEAQARGIKLIATLWWTPRWASAGGLPNEAPTNPANYGAFAHFITARYGSELAAVEAWNEPNWHSNLVALNVPLAYAGMLKEFYTGAKQGDAGVAVLAGSMAYADLAFLGQLYAYGIKGYYDGISLHPYADGAAPGNTSVTHSFQGAIEKLHLFQLANGDSTPEWITEFGWPVGTSAGANTEAQQAEYIEKAFGLLNRLPYVAAGTAYQLRDMGTEPSNPEDNFGLLHQNFNTRPSYKAFTRAMQASAANMAFIAVP